jgi:glycogen phosphorylase
VRNWFVFTTPTPVPAGHDKFTLDLAYRVLQRKEFEKMKDIFCEEGMLNMTCAAMNLSRYINGVAKKHGEVSRSMFAEYTIHSITNGVHADYWICPEIQKILDRHIPDWREDNYEMRYALNIPREAIAEAHMAAKKRLLNYVKATQGVDLKESTFLMGSARRATPYKRGTSEGHCKKGRAFKRHFCRQGAPQG